MRVAVAVCALGCALSGSAWGEVRRLAPPPDANAPAAATQAAASKTGDGALAWGHSLKEGYGQALKEKKPILLVLGADWCQPCKVLEREMAQPDAAKALARWVRVHLDVDRSDEAAGLLENGVIPLMRVLSPTGRRIDFKEGAMKSADLARWLDGAYDAALAASGEELVGEGAPDAAATTKLVAHLADTDAALREAAIKRLLPYRSTAASDVARAFAKGNLLTRLACLDLLSEWKGPVAGLDPWQPETITTQRLEAIEQWAAKAKSTPASKPTSAPAALGAPQLEEARRELLRYLAAPSRPEAGALRERLARLGAALLPEVRLRLSQSPSDAARERLLALRYRLAASDALAVSWPGGLDRLASMDAQTRHTAAEELVQRAAAEDGPLLLELFSDVDPLVREIALRGLQAVGKGDAAKALVGLLNDNDPNVRAAVLKQLASSPSPGMLAAVIDFAKRETDPDLVVHAVRVLRESKSTTAVDGLLALTEHASWRVRAEAAEALAEIGENHSDGSNVALAARINVAMVKLLDDPDGFVVSRALGALSKADVTIAIDAMAKAADAHPELAPDVVRAIGQSRKSRFAAERHLRAFCFHKDDKVRSAAIAALCATTGNVEKEMKALLKDPNQGVRMWAAASLFSLINSWRPNGRPSTHTEGGFFGFGGHEVQDKNDPWEWAVAFRAGKKRPALWLGEVVPDLEAMMKLEGNETRLDAALALLPLTTRDDLAGIIGTCVGSEPRLATKAAGALPWLATPQRIDLFKRLVASPGVGEGRHGMGEITESMAVVRDPAVAPVFWDMLVGKANVSSRLGEVHEALRQIYFGDRYFSRDDTDPATLKRLVADATAHLKNGNDLQRTIALTMLLSASPADAHDPAVKIFNDPATSDALREDALVIALLSGTQVESARLAVAATTSRIESIRQMGVKFLATGSDGIRYLRDSVYLNFDNPQLEDRIYVSQNQPPNLAPPPGISAESLKPMLKDPNGETAAYAGYVLALLGDRSGLDPLLAYYRKNQNDNSVRRLVYRAAAALGDQEMVPVLEQIYKGYARQNYYVREFYWTIHSIGGEAALKLRKKIRDDVGMQQLR